MRARGRNRQSPHCAWAASPTDCTCCGYGGQRTFEVRASRVSRCPDAGGGAQARSAEAGNVRMRLEKAERAIEAERASVRELQRQLAAARQAPPAPSSPGSTPVAALRRSNRFCRPIAPSPAALQCFRLLELPRRPACFHPLLLAEPSSCLHHCRAKALRSVCLACALSCM